MADAKPTIREALWTHLNSLGRVLIVLVLTLAPVFFLSMIFPWEPFRSILRREPSVGDYIATVLLLMIDVPLGWAAWKAQRLDLSRRWLVVIYVVMIFFTMLEIRIALEKGERWHTRTELIVCFTLVITAMGVGHRRRVAPTPDSARPASNNP